MQEPGGYAGGGKAGASRGGSSSCCTTICCCEGLGCFRCCCSFSRKRSQKTSRSGAPAAACRNSPSRRSTPSTWSSAPPPPPRPPFPRGCRGKLGLFPPHHDRCVAHFSFPAPEPPPLTAQMCSAGGRTSVAIASSFWFSGKKEAEEGRRTARARRT
nr:unnamed protein product [Digitaria exilis]